MKIKKLLTLLAVTSMVAACGSNTGKSSSADQSSAPESSESAPASSDASSNESSADVSSESSAPATSESSAPASASSAAPASSESSAPAPSSSSTAPAPSSSSAPASSSSSAIPAPTLTGISVTAPTKTEYTTNDTQLDLAGMVVTANYSDGSSVAVTEGYEVSDVDFSTPGQKEVTVTYQGKTASFNISVVQYKPTAWEDALQANFATALYGYVPPFFYSNDLGYGDLTWRMSADNDVVYAIGSTSIPAATAGQDSPLKPVADLLIADGFVATTVPNAEEDDYFYVLEKAVTHETKERYIQTRIAMLDSQGTFSENGNFYFEISDAYYYSWAESGFEAAFKSAMKFTEDIPDLPDGARFLKRLKDYFETYASYGYVEITAYGVDATYANSYVTLLESANWQVFSSTREDFILDAISPESKIRLGIDFDSAKGELILNFEDAPTMPDEVVTVANIYNVSPFAFSYSDSAENYFYQFTGLKLDEGEDLGTLIDTYAAILTGDTNTSFVKKGDRVKQSATVWYDQFVDSTLGIRVVIFGFQGTTSYGVQISVEEYVDIPERFLPAIDLLGFDRNSCNVVAATETSSAYVWVHGQFATSVSYANALKQYTDILDNDTTLGFKVISALEDTTMSTGENAQHVEYANDTVKIEFLAWTTTTATLVQAVFYEYEPAPESTWVDGIQATIPEFSLAWDNDSQAFKFAAYRDLGDGETVAGVASGIAERLLKNENLGLDFLTDTGSSDPKETIIVLYAEEGSIEIIYSQYYGTRPVLFITVRLFDQNLPLMISAIGAVMGASLSLDAGTGYYIGYGYFNFSTTYSLSQYGAAILVNYVGANLTNATALGFSLTGRGMSGNNYIGQYKNNKNYVVQITLIGDANKNYTGNYQVLVVPPSE